MIKLKTIQTCDSRHLETVYLRLRTSHGGRSEVIRVKGDELAGRFHIFDPVQ